MGSLVPGLFLVSNIIQKECDKAVMLAMPKACGSTVLCTKKAVLTTEVSITVKRQSRKRFLLITCWLEYTIWEENLALLPKNPEWIQI